jgi:phosphinothricin acetyltransferase
MLYRALLELLTSQGFVRAFGGIALPNAPSVGLHEAMGFAPIGIYRRVGYKLGAWRDVGWWGYDLAEPTLTPAPPRSFDPVTATAILQQL